MIKYLKQTIGNSYELNDKFSIHQHSDIYTQHNHILPCTLIYVISFHKMNISTNRVSKQMPSPFHEVLLKHGGFENS